MNDIKGIIEDVEKSSLVSDEVIKKVIEIIGQEKWQDINDEKSDICTTTGELVITLKRIPDLEEENAELEDQIADIKANCDFAIEGRDVKIKELELELTVEKDQHQEEINLHLHAEDYIKSLEQQIVKMKRHCNCKHRDGEGYCEVKRTYLMDLSYDGCDKWELED